MTHRVRLIVVSVMCTFLVGCGKYGPPLPPESVAPAAPQDVAVEAGEGGVSLVWVSPDQDVRGKPLKSLAGFTVERARLSDPRASAEGSSVEVAPLVHEISFNQLVFVEDTSLQSLQVERERLRNEGKPVRRARATVESKRHVVVDSDVERGVVYFFRLTPISARGTRGSPSPVYRVRFQGSQSRIAIVRQPRALFDDQEVPFEDEPS